jgi:hypothetical protein
MWTIGRSKRARLISEGHNGVTKVQCVSSKEKEVLQGQRFSFLFLFPFFFNIVLRFFMSFWINRRREVKFAETQDLSMCL